MTNSQEELALRSSHQLYCAFSDEDNDTCEDDELARAEAQWELEKRR